MTTTQKRRKVDDDADDLKATLETLFGQSADHIIELLETNDNEGAVTLTQKRLLATVIQLIPQAESNIRTSKGGRGIYAFNSLVSQCRELIADIQATQDSQLIANSINVNSVQPTFISITQRLIDSNYRLKKALRDKIKSAELKEASSLIDESSREMARYLQEAYKDLAAKIEQRLVD